MPAETLPLVRIAVDQGPFQTLAQRDLLQMGLIAHRVAGTDRIVVSKQVRPGVWAPMVTRMLLEHSGEEEA
jgi:hypothetical protein